MKESIINIDLVNDSLVDLDYLSKGSYIGITNKGNIITPLVNLKVEQSFQFPLIRQIKDNMFLIVESRIESRTNNGFVYDLNGNLLANFFVGDGVQDIEIVKDKIVVTYFDEGVYGMDGPNNEGLVVFDLQGKSILNYNEKQGDQIISDCYCICKHGANRILFLPYSEFPLVELNLDNLKENIYEIPKELKGSNAITSTLNNDIIFHSPYNSERGLFKWNLKNKNVEKIGEYCEGLRGLKNGKFLSKGEKGFTIIDLN